MTRGVSWRWHAGWLPSGSVKKVPKYAAHVPRAELVSVLCHCTRMPTLARLIHVGPRDGVKPDEQFAQYEAECLKCGHRVQNNYNWTRF